MFYLRHVVSLEGALGECVVKRIQNLVFFVLSYSQYIVLVIKLGGLRKEKIIWETNRENL